MTDNKDEDEVGQISNIISSADETSAELKIFMYWIYIVTSNGSPISLVVTKPYVWYQLGGAG